MSAESDSPKTSPARTVALYLSSESPWGPGFAGGLTAALVILGAAVVLPPIFWVLGLWWRVWL